MTETFLECGDVVIENGGNIDVSDAQDVVVRSGGVPYGETTIQGAMDVELGDDSSWSALRESNVADSGEDVDVHCVEDVEVKPEGALGDCLVNGAEDVLVNPSGETLVEDCEDVYVQTAAITNQSVTIRNVEDVFISGRAVDGDVTVDYGEQVVVDTGAVAGDIHEEERDSPSSYSTAGGHLRLSGVDDVHVESAAISGDLTITDAELVR